LSAKSVKSENQISCYPKREEKYFVFW